MKIFFRRLFVLLIATLSVTVYAQGSEKETAEELRKLFSEEWKVRMENNPVWATQMGILEKNHLLPDVSEASYNKQLIQQKGFLKQLEKIDFSSLSQFDKVNYEIFKAQLKRSISEIEFKTYQMPFLADSGFHTGFNRLNLSVPLKTQKHYEDYLNRLSLISDYFDQNIKNMNNGLNRGFSMPRVVMNGFTEIINSVHSKAVLESSFYQPFNKMPDSINKKVQKKLKTRAIDIIEKSVYPAYEKVEKYFAEVYIPATRNSLGAHSLPNGKRFYEYQVGHYTTLDLTAEQVHQIGLKEVARIRAEMEEVIKATGHKGDFKSFLKFLRESPQFYAKTPEELIKEASYISKKMDGKLPKLFTHLPRQPYTVEPVPAAIAPKYTTGRYSGAPIDSDRPGEYWVNTYALDKRPLYVLEALTLHEAVPGHHLQTALNRELKGLPEFRRNSYISAFGEGWALYSERLGLEVGFYQDHYSNFGRLTYEMWRAARLVIDTGIHAKGWTREEAIKLLEDNSALSTHNIRTEVDRYISWPGQALAYKIGEIKIKELRLKAEKQLGEKFDIRKFHDAILAQGSVPLNVLEMQVNDFIESHK